MGNKEKEEVTELQYLESHVAESNKDIKQFKTSVPERRGEKRMGHSTPRR